MIYYSGLQRGFFDSSVHLEIPADAVEVSAELRSQLLAEESETRQIQPDANGNPILVNKK